jgi:hypothetical protein
MRTSLACEDLGFIRRPYCYVFYENDDSKTFYVRLVAEKVLKPRDFVWVKLQVGENDTEGSKPQTMEGCVMRQKWKNLRRRNLTYQIGNHPAKKLSDMTISVDFRPYSYCNYAQPIRFDLLLPKE